MVPGEAELVSEWTGLSGRATSVKRFERPNGLDNLLYKNYVLVEVSVAATVVKQHIPNRAEMKKIVTEQQFSSVIFDDQYDADNTRTHNFKSVELSEQLLWSLGKKRALILSY